MNKKCMYCHKEIRRGTVCDNCDHEMPGDPSDDEGIITERDER